MGAYDRNVFRTGEALAASAERLDDVWREIAAHAGGWGRGLLRAREAAALVAAARWSKASALQRRESRGMHRREDAPGLDPRLASRQRAQGLDRIITRFEAASLEAVA